mmetsp:Transcript_21206/g.52174  ORF Transcript_21206/g.52174 Transcript_21206/m.52174 type:complete len:206 (-) Transcript_21206:1055-1672(-)
MDGSYFVTEILAVIVIKVPVAIIIIIVVEAVVTGCKYLANSSEVGTFEKFRCHTRLHLDRRYFVEIEAVALFRKVIMILIIVFSWHDASQFSFMITSFVKSHKTGLEKVSIVFLSTVVFDTQVKPIFSSFSVAVFSICIIQHAVVMQLSKVGKNSMPQIVSAFLLSIEILIICQCIREHWCNAQSGLASVPNFQISHSATFILMI